jgi:hypothetical protein
MKGFSVTFERYFPHDEGDEVCEADERGFVIENASLRDAMRLGLEYSRPEWGGFCEADCRARDASSLTFDKWNDCTRENLQTGITESRSLHFPKTLSGASRARVCRLFGVIR